MSFLDRLASGFTQAVNQIQNEIGKYNNRPTMQAIIAGCAIIAAADGKIDADEKQKMIGFIQRNDAMKVFDLAEVRTFFEKIVDNIQFDAAIGRIEAMKYVSVVKDDPENARLLVRVCMAIGAADGNFDKDERNAVVEICNALGLSPREFGL